MRGILETLDSVVKLEAQVGSLTLVLLSVNSHLVSRDTTKMNSTGKTSMLDLNGLTPLSRRTVVVVVVVVVVCVVPVDLVVDGFSITIGTVVVMTKCDIVEDV
jgi:hypothetical protein